MKRALTDFSTFDTVKDLKDFLSQIPDDTCLYTYVEGDGGVNTIYFEFIEYEFATSDLYLNIDTYNTIY